MGYRPGTAPTGYLNQRHMDRKCQVIVDPHRGHIVKQMFEKVAHQQWSGRKVYHWLKFEMNFHTVGNKPLALGNVYRLLMNPFYHGIFEYPKKSGNWYQGKHEPLITKELFDEVQLQIKGNALKTREEREFAFTKIMTCGLCGSGISACEKYKKLKGGGMNVHVYYGCTKARDKHCPCGYMNETDLIKQLQKLIDNVDLNETSIKKKVEAEVVRYKKFHRSLLGEVSDMDVNDIDMKSYVKFLLKDGSLEEKRDIISCFKSPILFKSNSITLGLETSI